jgi:hypothetical protein
LRAACSILAIYVEVRQIIVDNLICLYYVIRDGGRYANTDETGFYLVRGKQHYAGGLAEILNARNYGHPGGTHRSFMNRETTERNRRRPRSFRGGWRAEHFPDRTQARAVHEHVSREGEPEDMRRDVRSNVGRQLGMINL